MFKYLPLVFTVREVCHTMPRVSSSQGFPVPHPFIESILKRRTQYALGRNLPLPRAEVVQLIKDAVRHSPSSYNSQSSRAVISSANTARSSGNSCAKY
jgi:hypothetical protein